MCKAQLTQLKKKNPRQYALDFLFALSDMSRLFASRQMNLEADCLVIILCAVFSELCE